MTKESKKISEITKDKNNYIASLDGDSLETTSIIVKNITKDNINSLSLESKTNYLVTVDLKSQNKIMHIPKNYFLNKKKVHI